MALYTVTDGVTVIHALDVNQYFNLLTGAMTDQDVTLGRRLLFTSSTFARLVVGPSGFAIRDQTDAKPIASFSLAQGLSLLPSSSAGGAAPSSYGSVLVKIAESTVFFAPATSVSFLSIPQVYRHLVLSVAGTTTASGFYQLNVNNDTGAANYNSTSWFTNGTAPSSVGVSYVIGTSGWQVAAGGVGGCGAIAFLPGYTLSIRNVLLSLSYGLSASNANMQFSMGDYVVMGPITSMTITGGAATSFSIGTVFSLYGIP